MKEREIRLRHGFVRIRRQTTTPFDPCNCDEETEYVRHIPIDASSTTPEGEVSFTFRITSKVHTAGPGYFVNLVAVYVPSSSDTLTVKVSATYPDDTREYYIHELDSHVPELIFKSTIGVFEHKPPIMAGLLCFCRPGTHPVDHFDLHMQLAVEGIAELIQLDFMNLPDTQIVKLFSHL